MQLGAVKDAWTDEANPTHNRGNDTSLTVYPVSNKRHRSLIEFDLSQLPAGACVNSAALLLSLTSVGSASETYGVHRLTHSWTEGNGLDNSGVTWALRDGVTAWASAGGDAVATATAQTATGIVAGVTLQWNVTADVTAFLAGTATNYGWLLKDENEGTGTQFRFASRETATVSSQPHLRVTFGACP